MSCVASGLLEKVHQDPSKVDWRFIADASADFGKTRSGRYDSIRALPR
jgi:hypothetical protein